MVSNRCFIAISQYAEHGRFLIQIQRRTSVGICLAAVGKFGLVVAVSAESYDGLLIDFTGVKSVL
jgi:hypothetical protein